MKNVCYSGGAKGADLEWGKVALSLGHELIHYGFQGHANKLNKHALSTEELASSYPFLLEANKTLKRSVPDPSKNLPDRVRYIYNLLARNYWQIKDTSTVYAVSELDGDQVVGGTAWAVQMAIDRGDVDVYVYDMGHSTWTLHDRKYGFIPYPPEIPTPIWPCGKWTGIGSQELTSDGLEAINFFKKTVDL